MRYFCLAWMPQSKSFFQSSTNTLRKSNNTVLNSLRQDPDALAKLRERLFILWGDLEERKMANRDTFDPFNRKQPVSAKPFICCIKEYGTKIVGNLEDEDPSDQCQSNNQLGWKRRFRMFGTTIYH